MKPEGAGSHIAAGKNDAQVRSKPHGYATGSRSLPDYHEADGNVIPGWEVRDGHRQSP